MVAPKNLVATLCLGLRSIANAAAVAMPNLADLSSIDARGFDIDMHALAVAAGAGNGDNSAAVLAALKKTDAATVYSGVTSAQYNPASFNSSLAIVEGVVSLIHDYVLTGFIAQSSKTMYSAAGAQALIDFVNTKLEPDTVFTDSEFTKNKAAFEKSGFISFIKNGLIILRGAVDFAFDPIEAHIPAAQLPAAQAAFGKVQQDYANAQALFNA